MTKTRLLKILSDIRACRAAKEWVRNTPGTPKELYKKCHNRIWLEFIAERSDVDFDWNEYRKGYDLLWREYWLVLRPDLRYRAFNRRTCNLIRKMVPWAQLKKALEAW